MAPRLAWVTQPYGQYILGDGGHARVVFDALGDPGAVILGSSDPVPDEGTLIHGVGDQQTRRDLVTAYGAERFEGVVHRSVTIGRCCTFGLAPQLMAGVIVQPSVTLGDFVLVNTKASIDHDCVVGEYVNIGPGAVLCGTVTLGAGCNIGAGAVVVQNVNLPDDTMVPAQSLVVSATDIRTL